MNYDYLIDSSAWMENFSGTQAGIQVEKVLSQGKNCTTITVIAELADKFERENILFEKYHEYIKSKTAILSLTEDIALEAAKVKKQLRKNAPDTSLIDAINLTTARHVNAQLVTCDTDFENAPNTLLIKKK